MTFHEVSSDEELVKKAQQGDIEAFNVLYQRHLTSVFTRVQFKIPEQDVADVTQEVFIAVIKSIKSFRGESKFKTWLWTLTNHKIADYYRYKQYKIPDEVDMDSDKFIKSLIVDFDPLHPSNDEINSLRKAFGELPDHYREILLQRFTDGLKFNEIAQQNSQSIEATKSLFRRSIAALRKQMEKSNA